MSEIATLSGDRIVVEPLDEASSCRLQNLARITSDGGVIWRAELPENTGPDCFVNVQLKDVSLVATTWTGHAVILDPESGQHVRSVFVK